MEKCSGGEKKVLQKCNIVIINVKSCNESYVKVCENECMWEPDKWDHKLSTLILGRRNKVALQSGG